MFKKLAMLALAALLALAPAAAAQETKVEVREGGQVRSVVFVVGLKEYFVNGQVPGVKMDAAPYVDKASGRTFVPIRYLAYGLGVAKEDVGWDGKARKVTLKKGGVAAELAVGSKVMRVNSAPRQMDVAPQLNAREGRTYLPARWVAEALGYEVDWDPQDRLVICWPKGQPRPEEDVAKVKERILSLGPAFTVPVSIAKWQSMPKEYKQRQWEIAEALAKAAKPYAGQPWDKSKWRLNNSWGAKDGEKIMMLGSVNDLKPNGVNLGGIDSEDGVMVLLDLWIEGDAVYIKAANADMGEPSSPDMWLVEPGNLVRYEVGDPYSYLGNPFIHRYDLKWVGWVDEEGLPHLGWADGKTHHIDEFPGFLFEYGDWYLYVPNPAYKGGS